jgi:sulfide:quinone oxidoreductase
MSGDAPRNGAPRVAVIGSSFAGLTGALELRKLLGDRARITVFDPRSRFTFVPSLIWVPFGDRDPDDITFPLEPVYRRRGIEFVNEAVLRVDLERRALLTDSGERAYDRVLVATGPRLAFERIPGLGPEGGHTQSVCTMEHALGARAAWDAFLRDPGDVVVGTAQGGSCFGASYEFLLNVHHRLRKAGLADAVRVTFVTSEPFLGHFGLGGVADSERRVARLFERLGIEGLANTAIREVAPGEMTLADGRTLPFAFSMIVPPFGGVGAVVESPGLANPAGFVPVDEQFRHPDHEEVFAAGVDVAIAPPARTMVPTGVPKTGYMSERMARTAARNIAADLGVGEHERVPLDALDAVCILDAGNTGMVLRTDRVLGDAKHARIFQGPPAHWAKVAFERLFLTTRRHGRLVG